MLVDGPRQDSMIGDRRTFLRWMSLRLGALVTVLAGYAPVGGHEQAPAKAPALGRRSMTWAETA